MNRHFRLTRIAALIVAGATVVRPGSASLHDQVAYAARACRWVDPLMGTSGVAFDFHVPPPANGGVQFRHLLDLSGGGRAHALR